MAFHSVGNTNPSPTKAPIIVDAVKYGAHSNKPDGACENVGTISDPDVARNRGALSDPDLCVGEVHVAEGGRNWHFRVIVNDTKPGPLWALPHNNEHSAFATAAYAVSRYGGVIVAVETGGQRRFLGQDPNRNFGEGGCRQQEFPSPRFTDAFFSRWNRAYPIIALHNNFKNYGAEIPHLYPNARIFKPNKAFPGAISPNNVMVFIASRRSPAQDEAKAAIARALNEKRITVVYEIVSPRFYDCSMSNYAAMHGFDRYFDIDVHDGDTSTQKAIVDLIMHSFSN